jgi:hypothetical protein
VRMRVAPAIPREIVLMLVVLVVSMRMHVLHGSCTCSCSCRSRRCSQTPSAISAAAIRTECREPQAR